MSKVPTKLRSGIAAVLIAGGGGAAYTYIDRNTSELLRHEYVQAVARDVYTSEAVKVAMVMGAYYESSYKHIGKPYVDRLGKGQPLTVCNGITGKDVVAEKSYTPRDCYLLERRVYLANEFTLIGDLPRWGDMTVFQQATFIDFLHNKGEGAWSTSTMRRRVLAGDVVGACRQNLRWNRGTINGVSTVLPGLNVRAGANAELCEKGLT